MGASSRFIAKAALALALAFALAPAAAFGGQPAGASASTAHGLTANADTPGPETGPETTGSTSGTVPETGPGNEAAGETDPDPAPEPAPDPIDIAKASVSFKRPSWPCTGRKILPEPRVKLGRTVLRKGPDYTVRYANNKHVGKATAIITGKGNYCGKTTAHFTIVPATVRIVSAKSTDAGLATIKVNKAKGATGYQIKMGTDKKLSKNVRRVRTSDRTCTIVNLKKGKRYRIKVRAWAAVGGKRIWGAWSQAKTVTVLKDGKWKKSGGYFYYAKPTGKLAKGPTVIDGKTYLFDKKGRQQTGWQWCGRAYRFFNPANKQDGYMQTNCIVNGIKLRRNGTAVESGNAGAELYVMWKAQKVLESLTTPAQSQRKKLLAGFNWMRDSCNENNPRAFSNYSGWHRTFALDILDNRTGSCFSCGAAFAYYANAVGCESCAAVSSGGHGWAEVDGCVYDVEWSRHSPLNYFAFPYSSSGSNGAPNYAAARNYVVWIAPQTGRW